MILYVYNSMNMKPTFKRQEHLKPNLEDRYTGSLMYCNSWAYFTTLFYEWSKTDA